MARTRVHKRHIFTGHEGCHCFCTCVRCWTNVLGWARASTILQLVIDSLAPIPGSHREPAHNKVPDSCIMQCMYKCELYYRTALRIAHSRTQHTHIHSGADNGCAWFKHPYRGRNKCLAAVIPYYSHSPVTKYGETGTVGISEYGAFTIYSTNRSPFLHCMVGKSWLLSIQYTA